MTRHLHSVPRPATGPAFVIGRSRYVRPGAPFVLAHCAGPAVAAVFALGGTEVRSRQEMDADPALTEALRAWEAGDHRLFEQEQAARAAFAKQDRRDLARRLPHPSAVAKLSLP
jgi:hypothetical protein